MTQPKETPLENGFYWIQHIEDGEWTIGVWSGSKWFLIGSQTGVEYQDIFAYDTAPIVRGPQRLIIGMLDEGSIGLPTLDVRFGDGTKPKCSAIAVRSKADDFTEVQLSMCVDGEVVKFADDFK